MSPWPEVDRRRASTFAFALFAAVAGCRASGELKAPTQSPSDGSPEASATLGAERQDAETPSSRPPTEADTALPGSWTNVTPSQVDLVKGDCGNYGTKTVQADARHPGDLYTLFFCQGVWKSRDYGQTWTGPVNEGKNGPTFGDCAGGIALPPDNASDPPTIYASCIRGSGLGFWRSTNGGIDWTRFAVGSATNQEFYPPTVDPYDAKHLLMTGHAIDLLVESTDGGATWSTIVTAAGMAGRGGTGEIEFVDVGNAPKTRTTWLWLGAQAGGSVGTWRTTDGGKTWTRVDANEHTNGATQIYQPDANGVVYMAGVYSALGWGVLRSPDYGQHWAHVGSGAQETIIFGTSKRLYAMYGWGQPADPALETTPQPGTGAWTQPGLPSAMTLGPAQAAVVNDGKNNIVVVANYNGGLWRYVEP